jgi:hydroxyacylglutathione hydrolase
MNVALVPCLSDNYAYLLKVGEHCAVVDPSEADPVNAVLDRLGWEPSYILNTHHHPDHTGGNLALKQEYDAKIVGPGKDAARIPGLDIGVDEMSGWEFAGQKVRVLEVPGHTRGAITFVIDTSAFTGDTLFAMGCGRLFEGNADQMFANMQRLAALAPETIVYCAHEYTQSNGSYALVAEPGNAAIVERMKQVDAARARGEATVPTTIALERATNPFMRADTVQQLAERRAAKDAFRG